MINWYYMVVIACLLVVFLFYKEWKREKRSFLYGRLLASLLAAGSLLRLAYPYTDTAAPKKIIILTAGFVKDSIDNFLQQHAGGSFFSEAPLQKYTNGHVQLVADWNAFAAKHAADTFHIFGEGLGSEALGSLHDHPIVFHASTVTAAISHIYWKQNLEPGEQLVVQGSYENNSSKKIKLLLQAFGADKDSVFVAAGAHQDFELHMVPVHTGQAVYSLMAVAGNDTLQKEPVPADVQVTQPLQLLIISSSPDFDNTYLKNHLSQRGYQVTIKTTISSNKTDKQFLNMPVQQAAERLTLSYLSKFDVLMADQEILQKISAAELSAIRTAVRDNGTGLLIKMDKENKQAFYTRFFPVKEWEKGKESSLQLRNTVTDSNQYKIKATDPASIVYMPGTQIILQDAQTNIYAAGIIYGAGKMVATTLQNTYSMALAGNTDSYQKLWGLLLNKAAKKINPEETGRTNPFISFINSPVQLQVEKTGLALPWTIGDQTNIYFKQDTLLPFVWRGMYWPVEPGWQPLPGVYPAGGSWYVYKTSDWQQLIGYRHTVATKKYASHHPVLFTAEKKMPGSMLLSMRLCMLLIFVGSCIFLWVEQKIG